MKQSTPHTIRSLRLDLDVLGVRPGEVVIVHASMRSIGFVVGGAQAVATALLDAVGPNGTVVVPTHTSDNCDPAGWASPPVPADWWPIIRQQAPGFDRARSPSRRMGVLAETIRTWPGATRSKHPTMSFAAVGAHAVEITHGHQLDDALGENSPLGVIYWLNAKVLLIGCGHDTNTSLHLGEWRQPSPPRGEHGASIRQADGTSTWVTWVDVLEREDDFEELGAAFEATGAVTVGRLGEAQSRLMPQRAVVDFATDWLTDHRLTEATVALGS